MKKLVKDLKDGDKVYVVWKDPDTVIECVIKIKFDDTWYGPEGYFTDCYRGTVYSGKNKMSKNHYGDFQVFRVGTAGIWDEDCDIKKEDLHKYYPYVPGSRPLEVYYTELNSTHFEVYDGFEVFTNLDDAKDYIVDRKLEKMREDLKKLIKVKRYKEKETE